MKLQIGEEIVTIDFKYENGSRPFRKKDKKPPIDKFQNSFKKVKEDKQGVDTIVTTCTMTFSEFKRNYNQKLRPVKVVADLYNHNKEFARKYAIKRFFLINEVKDKAYRTKIWEAYFEYTKSTKEDYLGIDEFTFQNVDGEIFICFDNNTTLKAISLTDEQRKLLIKLLK